MPLPMSEELYPPPVITGPEHASDGKTPEWMLPGVKASLPAPEPAPGAAETTAPRLGPSTLTTPTQFFAGITGLGMLYSLHHWARPTLRAARAEQRGGVWGWLTSALDAIQQWVNHGANFVGHEVSKGAAHNAHGPAHAIDLMATRWEQLSWHVAYLAHTLDVVLQRIVHRVIPHEIRRQVAPVKVQVRKLRVGFTTLTADLNALRAWVHHELNRNVKPRLGRVEQATRHGLPNRIARGERAQTRTGVQVRRHGHDIGKLLPLLTIAGATGLVLKAFSRLGLNFLTCRNVKEFGNELCPSGSGAGRGLGRVWRNLFGRYGRLLEELTALAFVPFILTEACQIVHNIEALAIKVQPEIDALVLGIEGFVCDKDEWEPSAIVASDYARAPSLPSAV